MWEFIIGGGLGVFLGYLIWRPSPPPPLDVEKVLNAVEMTAKKRIDEAERHTIDIAVPLLKTQRDEILDTIRHVLK